MLETSVLQTLRKRHCKLLITQFLHCVTFVCRWNCAATDGQKCGQILTKVFKSYYTEWQSYWRFQWKLSRRNHISSGHIMYVYASMPCSSHKWGPVGVSQITLADVCFFTIDSPDGWIVVVMQCFQQALNKSMNTDARIVNCGSNPLNWWASRSRKINDTRSRITQNFS